MSLLRPPLPVLALALTLASCTGPVVERDPLEPQTVARVARSLFDGTSLAGWDGDPRFWSVQDGVITGASTVAQPCERTTYLVWRGGEVADFELSFSFRITGGNSGLQFRSRTIGPWDVSGYQADLEDGPNWTGCLYEQNGRGVVARRGQRVSFDAQGAMGVETFADGEQLLTAVRPGEWNEYRVRAVGPRMVLAVNGRVMSEVIDRDLRRAARSGLLAFQLHQGPPMRIELRDVLLTELEASAEAREPVAGSAGPPPQWLWSHAKPAGDEQVWLRREFELGRAPETASLTGTCDNVMEVWLNGERVLSSDDWMRPVRAEVAEHLRPGPNVLALHGRNEGGPAGAWLRLEMVDGDGLSRALVTDDTWSASGVELAGWREPAADPTGWSAAHAFGPLGIGPWAAVSGDPAEATPGQALGAQALVLPPGFEAELLYSVPRASEGSWVSLAIDPAGRLIVSDQYGGLFRVEVPPFDAPAPAAVRVEPMGVELGEAHGLLYAFDSLYAVVSGAGKYESGLYRVRDTNGDDRYDSVELLKPFEGTGEHGPHAVVRGPDGKSLFVVGGNHTALPAGISRHRVLPDWGEDQLLPRRGDPNGHAVGVMAPGGWVCRTDPGGEVWELYAAGMRNAYDLAFDSEGELFTFDSDMEWDVGLPWYRPTRILHVTSGADFGWRHGSGKWPATYPDSLPAVADVGLASPTGTVFGTSTNFPGHYRRALFAADWAYGTIYSVHLEPHASSYGASVEPFVRGEPLPVTDMAVGPDGALYFVTGGRRTQSGLYRVRWVGERPQVEQQPDQDSRPPAARLLRRSFEDAHGVRDPDLVELAWKVLDDDDRFLVYAARVAIEHQDPSTWTARALAESEPRVMVPALVALARLGRPELRKEILLRLASLPLERLDDLRLIAVLRACALTFIRGGPPAEGAADLIELRLRGLYPTGRDAVDRELCQLLVYLESPDVVADTLSILRGAQAEQGLTYAFTLRTLERGWTLDQRREYFRWIDEVAAGLSGGNSFEKYVAGMRADAVATLSATEREVLAGEIVLEPGAETGASSEERTADPVEAEPAAFVRKWTVADLVDDLPQLSSGRNFERGRQAFESTTCLECHRIADIGGSTGPDVTGAASRFSARDLLEAIVEPSAVISDQYQDSELRTVSGELIVGRIQERDDQRVVLLGMPPDEERIEVPTAEIEDLRPHSLSRMPEGLIDTLTREAVLDLMAYVLAGGDPAHPAFR